MRRQRSIVKFGIESCLKSRFVETFGIYRGFVGWLSYPKRTFAFLALAFVADINECVGHFCYVIQQHLRSFVIKIILWKTKEDFILQKVRLLGGRKVCCVKMHCLVTCYKIFFTDQNSYSPGLNSFHLCVRLTSRPVRSVLWKISHNWPITRISGK